MEISEFDVGDFSFRNLIIRSRSFIRQASRISIPQKSIVALIVQVATHCWWTKDELHVVFK